MIFIVNDLLNPKVNVPTSKGADSYMQSTAKHSKMGQKLRNQHFWPYLSNSYSTNFISIAMKLQNTAVAGSCSMYIKLKCSGYIFLQVEL